SGDVTGYDDLIRLIHTDLGIATVIPAFVVGLHNAQLGVGAAHLRCVLRRLVHLFRRFAPTRFAHALAFSLGLGTPRTLGLGVGLGWRLQALHSRPDGGQTVFTAGQLGRQCITTPPAQGRIVLGIVLVRLRDQGLNLLAQAFDFLLHVAIAHGFV